MSESKPTAPSQYEFRTELPPLHEADARLLRQVERSLPADKKALLWDVRWRLTHADGAPATASPMQELLKMSTEWREEHERTRLTSVTQAYELIDHAIHGRGDDGGPFDPDCPCRGTARESTCALAGCGFCSAGAGEAMMCRDCNDTGYVLSVDGCVRCLRGAPHGAAAFGGQLERERDEARIELAATLAKLDATLTEWRIERERAIRARAADREAMGAALEALETLLPGRLAQSGVLISDAFAKLRTCLGKGGG